jgi:hypothetical protein
MAVTSSRNLTKIAFAVELRHAVPLHNVAGITESDALKLPDQAQF